MESKYSQRTKDIQERSAQERQEYQVKIKSLEREKAHLNEKLELVIRDQSSESSNLSKRYEKEREQNDRLQEENEAIKAEKDRKIFEYQTKLERERENFNTRKREVEKRA